MDYRIFEYRYIDKKTKELLKQVDQSISQSSYSKYESYLKKIR